MKKKKISKKDVERINKKILEIKKAQKKRESKYKEKLSEQKERTEKVESGVFSAIQTKRNTKKQLQERIDKIEKERKDIIKKRIASFEKGTYFPQASYNQQLKKLQEEKGKKERLLKGIKSAKGELQKQRKTENIQGFKTKALVLGSRVEAGINVALEGSLSKLKQIAKKPITSKRVLKKSKMSYTMPKKEIVNVFDDENRFFKGAIKNGLI